jgi:hypothetical protein
MFGISHRHHFAGGQFFHVPEFWHAGAGNLTTISGGGNIVVQGNTGGTVHIQTGAVTQQQAEKIYNIEKIYKADFL